MEKEHLWKDAHSLWIRFCGVSDELKTLRDRWTFLSHLPFAPLPPCENLFERLESFSNSLEGLFLELGFSRYRLEKRNYYNSATEKLTLLEVEYITSKLRIMFTQLQEYFGTLKMSFFQRTSSLEIPHLIGLARSPQKTMGDEILHQAADNVTASYLDCLRSSPDLLWDNVTSIIYPDETGFIGAELHIKPFVKTFHISLSEDGKYFPGAFLLLAHESAHVTMYKVFNGLTKFKGWLIATQKNFSNCFENWKAIRDATLDKNICANCLYYKSIMNLFLNRWELFRNCVADVLAIEIGGVCTLFALVDWNPDLVTLFRVSFAAGYYYAERGISEDVSGEKESLHNMLSVRRRTDCLRGNPELCLNFIMELGRETGNAFYNDNTKIVWDKLSPLSPSLSKTDFEPSHTRKNEYQLRHNICRNFLDLPCNEALCSSTGGSIIQHLVKKRFLYSYNQEMAERLNDGICLPDHVDPRHTLHVFYKAFRLKAPPSFSATVQTLAFAKPKYLPESSMEL